MSQVPELMQRLRDLGVHLRLEGDGLRLNAPKGALTAELQAELKAAKPEIMVLLRAAQNNSGRSAMAPIQRIKREERMPLSLAQQRLWFLEQMDPGTALYNLIGLLRVEGSLDEDALERALQAIVQRHESLRMTFSQEEGTPFIRIGDGLGWKLQKLTLLSREGESLESAAHCFAKSQLEDVFNLQTGPLFRTFLVQVGETETVLALMIHHIVSDGWSIGVMIREIAENYRAFQLHEKPRLPELPVQYLDYAEWQRNWLNSGVLERQMQYWRKQLQGAPPVVVFPLDHPRTPQTSARGNRARLVLSPEFKDQLEAFSRAHDATLFMTMLAAFLLLLSRYSGLKDVVVGSPSANRNRAELSDLVGFFVNSLVLRVAVEDGISFLDLLARVREVTLGAFEHQDAPFDQLVREIQSDRGPEVSPLFQTMFSLQNFPMEELQLPDVTITPLEIDGLLARFDLTVEIYPFRGQLLVYFDYRADLYDEETMAELQESFRHVLQSVIEAPETMVEAVPLLKDAAKERLLALGNDTAKQLPQDGLLLQSLKRSSIEHPNKAAARAGGDVLSYRQLAERSDALSAQLRAAGACRGILVPVCLSRTTDLLVALLAVLKSGAGYVPLDPIYPERRIAGILEDVQPKVLVTERTLLPLVGQYERQCIVLEDGWYATSEMCSESTSLDEPREEDIAYVIFTSGSTGRPKGVEITHGALANFLESMSAIPGFTSGDRLLAVTTVSFDIAGLELFLPIYVGGEVVIARAPGDLPALLDELEREQPTVMQATPALWQMLLSAGWEGDGALKALCGGEALTPQLATLLLPKVKELWNMYGPTETTIWSSALRIASGDGASIPVGGPILNTTFYVLDQRKEPVPFGVAGELYIGGAGVAKGYFHRPELTSERFVVLPGLRSERLYRTGDLVRRRRDGTLEFLGRADFQVKLRGFRIELGEIEHALRQQREVAEAVVLLREDHGQKELIAYLVLKAGESLAFGTLRQRLRDRIPEYMVPAGMVVLDRFPRLPNGKLDRNQLPAPQVEASARLEVISPTTGTPTEAAVAAVFRELLHTESIGLDQRFFDVGAHSLLLVKAHDQLRRELYPQLRLVSLFQYPSITSLAAHIDQSRDWENRHTREAAHASPAIVS